MKSRTYGHQDLRPLTQYLNCLKTFRNMKQIDLYPLGYIIEAETFHIFRLNTNLISILTYLLHIDNLTYSCTKYAKLNEN